MNLTAEKLRKAAYYIEDGEVCSDTAIATVHGMFDVGRASTFSGDLGRVLEAIADELDELDDKAARRRSHIVTLESTIAERNRELRELRGQVPTERERQILDMWPRFEDGEPVMIGDGVDSLGGEIIEVYIAGNAAAIWNNSGNHMHLSLGERVKRPARSVLDADGVEIKVGDTVWHEDGTELVVIAFGDVQDGETMLVVEHVAGPTEWDEVRCLSVTHRRRVLDADGVEIRVGDTVWHEDGSEWLVEEITRLGARCFDGDRRRTFIPAFLTHTPPDSWKRLEEDAAKHPCVYAEGVKGGKFSKCSECPWGNECDGSRAGEMMARDVIRRAKALAGIEVDE